MIKHTYACDKCGREIKDGETFFRWEVFLEKAVAAAVGTKYPTPTFPYSDGICVNVFPKTYHTCAECNAELKAFIGADGAGN